LKPYGDTRVEDMYDNFAAQMAALAQEGVDVICVETMTDLQEATQAVRAAKAASPTTPVIATMTFDLTPRGFYTMMGVSVEQAARGLEEAGADIIGSNCGNGSDNMVQLAREFKKHSKLPLIIQSNAGMPTLDGDRTVYPETPEYMADRAKPLRDAGVVIIGGCCGTTPAHILAMKNVIHTLHSKVV